MAENKPTSSSSLLKREATSLSRPSAIPAPSKVRKTVATGTEQHASAIISSASRAAVSPRVSDLIRAKHIPSPSSGVVTVVRKPLNNIQLATTRSWQNEKAKTANANGQVGKATKAIEGPKRLTQPKRPNWDVKGLLEDEKAERLKLLEVNVHQEAIIKEKNEEILRLERRARDRDDDIANYQCQVEEMKAIELKCEERLAEAAREHAQSEQALALQIEQQIQLKDRVSSALSLEKSAHQDTKDALTQERAVAADLMDSIDGYKAEGIEQTQSINALKSQIAVLEDMMGARNFSITALQDDLTAAQKLIAELEERLHEGERIRKKLHNTIQELKGNIRVFCRVRPSLVQEEVAAIRYSGDDQNAIEISNTAESASGNAVDKVYPFAFDKVFAPGTSQAVVFEEISQLVQSALDGYNCCVFAYGQTSSGKTYTMEGKLTPEDAGMIPRAVQQIFAEAETLRIRGWEYAFEGQYLEIYNETINDLLGTKEFDKIKHEIKHDKGRTTVTDTVTVRLESPSEVSDLLTRATARRRVGETLMNARSSRSHSVFALRITGTNSGTGEHCEGVLNLVDLAGSERLNSSGATGERLKETVAINKSLSSLADVIAALGEGSSHIPYRNSRLTYLLQNSLGGNSKTLMFVNISPSAAHLQETLCSLRFATKVNTTQIGTAKRQVKHNV